MKSDFFEDERARDDGRRAAREGKQYSSENEAGRTAYRNEKDKIRFHESVFPKRSEWPDSAFKNYKDYDSGRVFTPPSLRDWIIGVGVFMIGFIFLAIKNLFHVSYELSFIIVLSFIACIGFCFLYSKVEAEAKGHPKIPIKKINKKLSIDKKQSFR